MKGLKVVNTESYKQNSYLLPTKEKPTKLWLENNYYVLVLLMIKVMLIKSHAE